MKLSVDLIAESMQQFNAHVMLQPETDFSFKQVRMLTAGIEETLENDVLYVSELRVLRKLPKEQIERNCFVFCVQSEKENAISTGMNGIIYDARFSLGEVMNHLLRLFDRFQTMEYKMRLAVSARLGLQPLIEVGKKMIPDATIVIVDSAYNIIAASRELGSGNAYVDKLLEQGYYDKDSLQSMAEVGYFSKSQRYLAPEVSLPPNICNDPVILRSYHADGLFYSFVACYFPGRCPTLADQKMVCCFTEQLDEYFQESGFYTQSIPKRQQMICDLLNYGENNPDLVRDRARTLHLPETGDFRLGYITFTDGDDVSRANHLCLQLRAWSNVANYGVFQVKSNVLIFFQDWHDYSVSEQLTFRDRWNEMLVILRKNKAKIGVSLLFTHLSKLKMAVEQAKSALEIGCQLNADATEYHYSKYYLNDMLSNYREKFSLEDISVRYIDSLIDEKGYGNSNLVLLYYYLNTERNISLTAKLVHMHRNSVIYRLQKIQDMLHLNLDDPNVRLRLMITFKILQMEGKLPELEDVGDFVTEDHFTLIE